jgi:hypothetical protein
MSMQGALVTSIEKRDAEWWYGDSEGMSGYFPADAVEELVCSITDPPIQWTTCMRIRLARIACY